MPELFVVPRSQVEAAWPEIERCLARVGDTPWSAQDVKHDLLAGRAQAWGLRQVEVLGFWLTRIENTSTARFGVVWITAGDGLHEGLPLYRDVIEPWLWEQGCKWIEIVGRRGWKKVMSGYEEVAVMLRKYR